MKKIILIFFLLISRVYAIENIEINNGLLVPIFDKEINKYNYFTSSDSIIINVKHNKDETINGDGYYDIVDGKNTFIVSSSNNEEYIINVFKNYKKDNTKSSIEDIIVKNYDINFNKNIYDYFISINDEECLDIDLVLSNDNTNYEIDGNCLFDKSDNIVTIKLNNEKYFIHVLKSINVSSNLKTSNIVHEITSQKKEIIILIIIIISCTLVFIFYYSLFINKTSLNI